MIAMSRHPSPTRLAILAWTILSVFLLSLSTGASISQAQEIGERMIVTVENAEVLKDGEPFTEFPLGQHLYIEETAPNYYIFRDRGEVLWIRHNDVKTMQEAREFFTARIEKEATAADLVVRGDILYRLGYHDKALEDLEQAEEIDDSIPDIYITRSAIFCEEDDYEVAQEEIELAAEFVPDHPTVLNIRGLIAYHYDDFDEAIEWYDKCLEANPSYSVAYSNRALVHIYLDDYDEAEADYARSIEVAPARSTGHANFGWYLNSYKDDTAAAKEQFDKALQLNPRDTTALYYRADIAFDENDFETYVRDMLIAVDAAPDEVEWKDNLAWHIATTRDKKLRDAAKALEFAKECVEESQWSDADHICTLAVAYGGVKNYDKALEILDRAEDEDDYDSYTDRIEGLRDAFENQSQYYRSFD